MKKKMDELSEKERIATLDALYTAAGTVRGRAAMKIFLRDLLTESERIMLGRRILIARLLLQDETAEAIEFGKRDFKKKYAKSMLFRFKKRYPLHFLLFPEPK